ncbi:MAG: hypothetical protein DDT31_01326 [Syntrophomonadaceae bacterium]|nr:hypothetical protein [Bacillota bacterium]
MEKNIKYKLTDSEGYTRRGCEGEIYWFSGIEQIAIGKGTKLCSEDVIHYYDSPDLAVLYNPIHANIENPRLIEIETGGCVVHDGLKGGCKRAKLIKEIPLPVWTIEEKLEYAIRISLVSYKEKDYIEWAENWLNGKDRTAASAESAESAARAAWASASAAWAAIASARAAWANASAAMFLQTSLKIIEKIKQKGTVQNETRT